MGLIDESKRWHDTATELLEDSGIERVLSDFGQVVHAGSYDYGLMFAPDIDLYVINDSADRDLAEEMSIALTKGGYWNSIMLDLAQRANQLFKESDQGLRQKLLEYVLSNIELKDKKLSYILNDPFKTIVEAKKKALSGSNSNI